MKTRSLFSACLALAVLAAGCSLQAVASHAKGKVLISAQKPAQRALSLARPHGAGASQPASRAAGPQQRNAVVQSTARSAIRARDLSAATDIASITYTISNVNPSSGEADITDVVDPSWPYIDLYLTPGQTYRIVVDVVPTAKAPGTNVGISRFGDQAVFTVDAYGGDTWVDLYVKPTKSLVFDPGSVSGTSVRVLDPASGGPPTTKTFLSSSFTSSANDKFFYDAKPNLYYFNMADDGVYRWKSTSGTITTWTTNNTVNDLVVDGFSFAGAPTTIYAVCADPYWPDSVWLAARDNNAPNDWYYYWVDLTGTYLPAKFGPITADLEDGNLGSVVVVTGIAVDPTFYDVYISFYNQNGATGQAHSGVLQYYYNSLGTLSVAAIPANRLLSDQYSTVVTDLAWEQGRLWVMGSPVTTPAWSGAANIPNNTGAAGLWAFDDYLNQYTDLPAGLETVFNGTAPTATGSRLYLPNRFTGSIQGRTMYLSQQNFAAAGPSVLSSVNLDSGVIRDHP